MAAITPSVRAASDPRASTVLGASAPTYRPASEIVASRYITIWDNGPASIIAKSGLVSSINKAALRVLRCSSNAEVVGKPVMDFITTDDATSPTTRSSGSPAARPSSLSISSTALTTKTKPYARLDSVGSEMDAETDEKVYWLHDPRSPTLSRRSSSMSSPVGRKTVDHLKNNQLARLAAVAGETAGPVLMEAEKLERTLNELALLSRLDEGTVSPSLTQNTPRVMLKNVLAQKTIAPHLSRILIDEASLSLLGTSLSLDWERLEYVMLSFIENACKNTSGPVKLSISYDSSSENLHVKIMDEGHGIQPDSNYLERALNGKAGPDHPEKDVKPGLIFRICNLLCHDVLAGSLLSETSRTGTQFQLIIPAVSAVVAMAELDMRTSLEGASSMPIGARTPPRGLPLRLPVLHETTGHSPPISKPPTPERVAPGLIGRMIRTITGKPSEHAYAAPAAEPVAPASADGHDAHSRLAEGSTGLAVSRTAPVGRPPIIFGQRGTGPVRHPAPTGAALRALSGLFTPARPGPSSATPASPADDSSVDGTPPKKQGTPPRLPPLSTVGLGGIAGPKPLGIAGGGISAELRRRIVDFPHEAGGEAGEGSFVPAFGGFVAQPSPKAAPRRSSMSAGGVGEDDVILGGVAASSHPPVKAVAVSTALEPIFVNLAVKLGMALPIEKPAAGGFGRAASDVEATATLIITEAGVRTRFPWTPPPSAVDEILAIKSRVAESAVRRASILAASRPAAASTAHDARAVADSYSAAPTHETVAARTAAAVAARFPRNAPVLVVEDETTIRMTLVRMLKKLGLTNVTEAVDGLKAVRLAGDALDEGRPYVLAFMDMMMPRLDGMATSRSLLSANPKMIIVPATSNHSPEELATYREIGMRVDPMIAKPQTPAAIKAVVDTYFEPAAAPAPAPATEATAGAV